MKDEKKTKEQLIKELAEMRQRIAESEALEIEYKQAEESLYQLKGVVETMPLGVTVTNMEGRIIYTNSAEAKMHGYEVKDLIGKDVGILAPPEHRKPMSLGQVKEIKNLPRESINIRKDGSSFPVRLMSDVIRGSEEVPLAIVTTCEDITERKRTEEALQRIQFSLEKSSDAIFWIDSEAYFIDVNEAACRSLGYTREELLTMALCDIDASFSKKVWSERWTELRQQGSFVLESSYQTKDGSVFPVEIVANYLKFGDREYSCAFVRNITERKRMQRVLEESEEKFRLIAETSGDAIFQINMDGVITYCSPAMVNSLGYPPEEVIGTNFTMYFNPPELAEDAETFQKILSGERVELLELQALSKDGIIVNTEVSVAPFIKNGNVVGVQGVARDITKRKQAEEALARTYRELVAKTAELENANEELSQYASVASHDLRTPLRAIHNYVDFLREDLEAILDDEQQMYLDSLYRAVREAEALVDDLLQLSRISQRSVPVETIDVSAFLQKLIASLDLPDDVEIVMADDWPTFDIEPVLFRQIFQNLIGNAAKFNKSSHKRVELGWRFVGDDHYEFFVRDNGIGIEPCYQEQIFRVFERLHTREEFEGTGIGLAIVKKAITKLGGSVRVESKPGEGSTFLLTLPRVETTTN